MRMIVVMSIMPSMMTGMTAQEPRWKRNDDTHISTFWIWRFDKTNIFYRQNCIFRFYPHFIYIYTHWFKWASGYPPHDTLLLLLEACLATYRFTNVKHTHIYIYIVLSPYYYGRDGSLLRMDHHRTKQIQAAIVKASTTLLRIFFRRIESTNVSMLPKEACRSCVLPWVRFNWARWPWRESLTAIATLSRSNII